VLVEAVRLSVESLKSAHKIIALNPAPPSFEPEPFFHLLAPHLSSNM
jgi:hypothetical protein